ncbi:hypothetical protein [Feifania hominis]|uniref:Uncharacterized protein n=1 Tax=Feifania hominis TaxID=2763660 RepID=A0A926DGC4_9FIRM|nr:hypothetical protein [Feifania hominis]MBC8537279.1 hypothetical protein [Feifania hominis]
MKKIINNKLYNTDTAERIACWDNGLLPTDFSRCSEELYRKRTGEFFLFGSGGANSKYAVSRGDNRWQGGSQITPLSWDSAREWAEEKLSANEYEAIFGEVSEDNGKTAITINITVSKAETARRAASQAGMSLSGYIESLIK